MTAHRDHRGRFVSDAEHAAGLLLEAAVAEALGMLRTAQPIERVENMFRQVTRSADLVLGSDA